MVEVAEFELQEYVQNSPSYIRVTTDFVYKMKDIEESVPDEAFLFCFDASKLYPSVPREEGMKACREALESRSAPLIPTEYVLEMTEVVLDNNSFKLGNHNYKQTEGIAIGSRLGRNFACSYMRKCDEELLGYEEQSLFYKRFVDDGFGVWTGTLTSLQEFASYAKGIRPNTKIARRKLSFWIHGPSLKMVTYIPTLTRSQQTSSSIYKEVHATIPTPGRGPGIWSWSQNKTNM